VSRDEHEKWFGDRLDDPATRICIGVLDGEAVGMVRIDVTAAVGEVSIALAPSERGKGIGGALLRRLQGDLAQDFQVMALTAAVHEGNIPSRKVFEAAGFRAERVDGHFHGLRWDKATG
jgi:RimJ/RimL family protein N-acetyltransferase